MRHMVLGTLTVLLIGLPILWLARTPAFIAGTLVGGVLLSAWGVLMLGAIVGAIVDLPGILRTDASWHERANLSQVQRKDREIACKP